MNEMIITDSQKVVEITSDQDVKVPEDGKDYHAADLVFFAALRQPKMHGEGNLEPGKRYNVKVLAVITELPDDLKEESESV